MSQGNSHFLRRHTVYMLFALPVFMAVTTGPWFIVARMLNR